MSTNDSLVGQLDLLMLPGSRMQIVDDMECIVIPKDANPAIFMTQTQSGQRKALLDIFVKATQNSRYGNTHFVKANVGKTNREKFGISREMLSRYSPILGNLKPYAAGQPSCDSCAAGADDDDLPEG